MTINLLKIPNESTKEIKEIRKAVFTDELNIPESYLFDEYDNTCEQKEIGPPSEPNVHMPADDWACSWSQSNFHSVCG